jgi:hypothetical protein
VYLRYGSPRFDRDGHVVYRHKRRQRVASNHDIAGWLYADVFLALMIMGVGSSVVVRQMIPSDSAAPPPAAAQATVSCREFAVPVNAQIVDGTDAALADYVTAAVDRQVMQRGWTSDVARPALVIVLGGFELYESAGDGDANARVLRTRLRRVVPMLTNVEMRTGGSRSALVDSDQIVVGNNGDFVLVVYLLHSDNVEQECV